MMVVFAGAAVTHSAANLFESGFGDGVNCTLGGKVAINLFRCPCGLELRHQIARGNYLHARAAHQFDRPCIHQTDVRHHIVRRILHGDGSVRLEYGFEVLAKLLIRRIGALRSREAVEAPGLNAMHQFLRFALGGNQVEPAARDEQCFRQAQHAIGNRIAMMMVVEQPCIHVAGLQRGLDFLQFHGEAHSEPAQGGKALLYQPGGLRQSPAATCFSAHRRDNLRRSA
jgi:hypothetical protein